MSDEKQNLDEGAIEAFITYKFIQILSTPWEEQGAFELGIIDKDGKVLKKTKDLNKSEERKAYTILHRLVFGLKRLMSKVPGLRTKLGTYAAALLLIKESQNLPEDSKMLEERFAQYVRKNDIPVPLGECILQEADTIKKGMYKISQDVVDLEGNIVKKGTKIKVGKDIKKAEKILGKNVFKIKIKNGSTIAVSQDDIKEV